MFLSLFTLFWAFLISATAAGFSIVGLTALFSASMWPIIIMGIVIEGGKLLAAAIAHKIWGIARYRIVKWYLVSAVIVGMAVTAMGVYGFLSEAHLKNESPMAGVELQIKRIEQRISVLNGEIARYEVQQKQLDGVVETLIQSGNIRGKNGANTIRESQTEERRIIQESIDGAYKEVGQLQDELLPLKMSNVAVEAKLGAVKYVAALFGWEDSGMAVRLMIFLLMWGFDPMAIVLVIVSIMMMEDRKARILKEKEDADRLIHEREEELRRIAHEEEERALALQEQQRLREEKAEKARLAEERKTLQMELDNRYRKEAEDLRVRLSAMEEMSQNSLSAIEEVVHLRDELSRKEDELQKMIDLAGQPNHEIQSLKESLVDIQKQKRDVDLELSAMTERHDALVGEKSELEKDLLVLVQELDSREEEIASLMELIRTLTDEIQHHDALVEKIEAEKAFFTGEIATLRSELEQYRALVDKLEDELATVSTSIKEQDLEIVNEELTRLLAVEVEYTALKSRYLVLHGETSQKDQTIQAMEEDNRALSIERETILNELVNRQGEVDRLKEERAVLEEEVNRLMAVIATSDGTKQALEADLKALVERVTYLEGIGSLEDLEALQQALNERERELNAFRAELEERTLSLNLKNAELEAVCEELEGNALQAKKHDADLRTAIEGNDRSRVLEILDRRPEILEDIIRIVTEYNGSSPIQDTRIKPDNPDAPSHWLT